MNAREVVRRRLGQTSLELWDMIEQSTGLEIMVTNKQGANPVLSVADPEDILSLASHDAATLVIPDPRQVGEISVVHELIHLRRYLVEGIPQIMPRNQSIDALWEITSEIENEIEHLFVIPEQRAYGYQPEDRFDPIAHQLWGNYPWTSYDPGRRKWLALKGWLYVVRLAKDPTIRGAANRTLRREPRLLKEGKRFAIAIERCGNSKSRMISTCLQFIGINSDLFHLVTLDAANRRRISASIPRQL